MKNANELNSIYENYKYLKGNYGKRKVELLDKLADNVVYQMSWVTESLFENAFKERVFDEINIMMVKCDDVDIAEAIEIKIKELQQFISSPNNVRENSSGSMHREVSTWKFVASIELIKELQSLVR